jgi:intraflagellar transport protein 80
VELCAIGTICLHGQQRGSQANAHTHTLTQISPPYAPLLTGLRIEFLDQQTVSLSSDTLAVLEHAGSCALRFFDSAQGRQLGEPFSHSLEVRAVALSQAGTAASRQLAFIDSNRDLHLLDVGSRAVVKLASMVDSAVWHDTSNMLAAVADDKLLVWHCPAAAFIDPDLLPATRVMRDDAAELGKGAQVVVFTGARCLLKRRDGAQVALAVAPYPASLHELVRTGQWDGATRLCR